MMREVEAHLRSFLCRDYYEDVIRLNKAISRSGNGAGLQPMMPPFAYSGNPFALRRKQCIALFGLNPRWLGPEDKWAEREYWPVKRAVDAFRSGQEAGFHEYRRIRAGYFDDDSTIYYGKYFTRLGNLIGKHLFGYHRSTPGNTFARSVFRQSIFKTDFLPWFSNNTSDISWGKVASSSSQDQALQSYYELISSFLTALEPRWIQCNGKESRQLAELLFEARFSEESVHGASGKRYIFFVGETTRPIGIPIISHSFGRFNGEDSFSAIAARFKALCGAHTFNFD
ncbi:hypothetical protein [Bradyrhizobium sp. STM 3562]|uniref:hypothetical protein n=1 Tax=Bradyrhizobium sp. STM 3562 TaxID=578924 RepID=UPI00388D1E6D